MVKIAVSESPDYYSDVGQLGAKDKRTKLVLNRTRRSDFLAHFDTDM